MAHDHGHEVLRGAAILIAVGDPAAGRGLVGELWSAGASRLVALGDPERCADVIGRERPDAVFLDLAGAGERGIEVLRSVVEAGGPDPLPVLALAQGSEQRRAALAAGAKDVVAPPPDGEEVALRLANLVENRVLHLALAAHNAELRAELGARDEAVRRAEEERRLACERIEAACRPGVVHCVLQPIVELDGLRVVGLEALARFGCEPVRSPDLWFGEADSVGLGAVLELVALQAAAAELDRVPPGAFLSVNVSPAAILDPGIAAFLAGLPGDRLVIELTEHRAVSDHPALLDTLARLRAGGARLALDDTGAGFAGLGQVLALQPELIKLDRSLISGIDVDPARRHLVSSMLTFADATGVVLVAEGIETGAELATLCDLGVSVGQGYHLCRPVAPEALPLRSGHLHTRSG